MKYVSRADQAKSTPSLFSEALKSTGTLSDELFDTPALPRPVAAVAWKRETDVHGAIRLTDSLRNTNQFYGTQVFAVRDEVRERTFVVSIEQRGLFLSRIEQASLTSRTLVHPGDIRRTHLCLRKFDGIPLACYVVSGPDRRQLFINDVPIDTASTNVDFPHLTIQQPPIGFAALDRPTVGILTYKCRTTGKVYLRRIDPMTLAVEPEIDLVLPPVLGGVDVAIGKNMSLLKAEVLVGNKIKPSIMTSADFFATNSGLTDIDLSAVPHDVVLPGVSKTFVDHTESLHLSLAVRAGGKSTALDVMPDDDLIVAAVEADDAAFAVITVFPRMPTVAGTLRFGFGDGETDGAGIIATLLSRGRLLASNSQTGGFRYPEAPEINYDMQKMYVYGQTECYTRGVKPNYVSMDYVFVEADESGRPLSSELWIETWDMPLPEPVVQSTWVKDRLKIVIGKGAWFFPGQTSFWIEPAVAEITKAEFVDYREMVLEFNDPSRVRGTRIWFDTKNVFYFHRAFVDA